MKPIGLNSTVNALGLMLLTLLFITGCPPAPNGPTAAFTTTPTHGSVPLNVEFQDNSIPGSADITAWAWDFGDGAVATEQNPSHVYAAAGTYSVSLTVTTSVGSHQTTQSNGITVGQTTPVISAWPAAAPIIYGQRLADSALTGGISSVAGTFTFDAPNTIPAAGFHSAPVTFTPIDTRAYANVSQNLTVVVKKAAPTIFQWPIAEPILYGQALSGLPLLAGRASTDGTFRVNDPDTLLSAGQREVNITFTPADTNNYTEVAGTISVTINPLSPEVFVWPTASILTYGQPLSESTLTGGSPNVPGTFTFDAPDMIPNAGIYSASVTFIPLDAANYQTVPGTVSMTINKATPRVLTWPTAAVIDYGQTLAQAILTGGSASVEGVFAYASPETVPNRDNYAATVTFTPNDTSGYLSTSGTIYIKINRANPGGWFVLPGGSGDGKSWVSAFGSIQEAVDAAAAEGGGEVWVAAGTYTATTDPVVAMAENVHLYGGFAGTETARAARNTVANATRIDGESARRCVNGANNATLDGFVLQNGQAEYGAGLFNYTASPTVTNCTFEQNNAKEAGGGLYNIFYSAPVLTDCTFIKNTAECGAGVYNYFFSAPALTRCAFVQNTVSGYGGGMYNASSSPVVSQCTFTGNRASHVYGGGMYNSVSSPTITNSVFIRNMAKNGGGMANFRSSPTLTNCTFTQNAAFNALDNDDNPGGAMFNYKASAPTITNSILWGNFPESSEDVSNQRDETEPSVPVVTYSCLQYDVIGTGNLSWDPLLIQTRGGNGRVRPNSPCINRGTRISAPGTDIRGVTRPQGTTVDMGAYEFDDSDSDGISDTWELARFGNLTAAFSGSDADNDGLSDLDESLYDSNPALDDSDADGVTDNEEVKQGWEPTMAPTLYRVRRANTSGVEDGHSWETAFTSIQDAVDACYARGGGEIWVAEGWYNARTDQDENVVAMRTGCHLYGGFAGEETVRESRNWTKNKTIIHGENKRRCVVGANGVRLDGFILQNGLIAGSGGGLYNYMVSPTVAHCVFLENFASYGGGIHNYGASPTVIDCTFIGNSAHEDGGAMNNENASPMVINCTFSENSASESGAMMNFRSSPTVSGCTFNDNVARNIYGGAMYNFNASPTITNCIFAKNSAYYGGAIYSSSDGRPRITNCTFTGNFSYSGAALYCYRDVSTVLSNCILWGNYTFSANINTFVVEDADLTITYSCVQGGCSGAGNIDVDPLFADASNAKCWLKTGSPCFDTGSPINAPQTDIRGVSRPQGIGIDMGAYELDDIEGDGISDTWEQAYFGNLTTASADSDADSDGLTDGNEYRFGSNPLASDTDGDGYSDSDEAARGWNPNIISGIRRVNVANASGVEDGLSWSTAFSSIQEAINTIEEGEIWVAAGVYTSTAYYVIAMKNNVHLYGGFAGTETQREDRDVKANPTGIDGESVRCCVLGANQSTLDGFIVQNGDAVNGGGVNNGFSSLSIAHCTFTGNSAYFGGAIYNASSSLAITNCMFTGNKAYCGSSLYNYNSVSSISHCTFAKNSAYCSGAMKNSYSSTSITNCMFTDNTANSHGGAMENSFSMLDITNCTFTENSAYYGGAMYNDFSLPSITNCIFWGDSALHGNEIYDNNGYAQYAHVTYSCVQGGYEGVGNIASDPLFAHPACGNYWFMPGSPCIDSGSAQNAPQTDIRGITRPQGNGIDMGAYELDDSEGDGLSDFWEQVYFGNLTAASADSDADRDGLTDGNEYLYGSNPRMLDTDGDGFSDGDEVARGWNPNIVSGIRRVSVANTSGVEDGLSWSTAFSSIQAAIDTIEEGEIWVAAGIYTSTADSVVVMKKIVHLYGGFAGTEIQREDRDVKANATRIDGESVRRCVLGANQSSLDGFIVQNGYAYSGGGVYNSNTAQALVDCVFTNNIAYRNGGAMHNYHSAPSIVNCTFTGNSASYDGGAIYNSYSSPSIVNSSFAGNSASYDGGALYNDNSSPTLTNSTFAGNSAHFGGAICNDNSSPFIANGMFGGNSAYYGGAVYTFSSIFYEAKPRIYNCLYINNTANSRGGAMYNSRSAPSIANCTFAVNSASESGDAIYNDLSLPSLTNCILWGNLRQNNHDIYNDNSSVQITYSCIQGGYYGTGNIASDPLFADPNNGDYTLQPNSPCIDTGTAENAPDTDILGTPRPQGTGFDMGAYEYVP